MKNSIVFDNAVADAYDRASAKFPIIIGKLNERNEKVNEYVKQYVNRNVWVCIDTGKCVTKKEKNELLASEYGFDEFTPMSEQYEYFLPVFDYADAYGDCMFED